MKFLLLIILSVNAYSFDHSHKEWDKFLKQTIVIKDKQSFVNYKKVKKLSKNLKSYLSSLENITKGEFKELNQKKKLSLLINLYNAYTIDLVSRNYPVESIKKIGPWYSSPWRIDFIPFLGKKVSLDKVEHEMIRPNFKEARIHFALNCASIGCPSILDQAFTHDGLETQLALSAKNFMTNSSKNQLKGKVLQISKIFDWYGEDFEKHSSGLKKFLGMYFTLPKDFEIEYRDYNWNLNDLK